MKLDSASETIIGKALGRRDLLKGAGLVLGGIALAPLLAACGAGSPEASGSKEPLAPTSFGVLRAPTGALAVVAGQHKWFSDAGVNVDFKSFAEGGGPAMITAMAGGTPEIGLLNMGTAILALAQGAFDVQIVSIPDDPAGALPILSIPSIKTVADLKGKSVACPKGGGQYYILALALAKFGMKITDIDYKPLSVGDGQAAFITGKVDAVISSANGTVLIKQNKPDTRVLFDPSKDFEKGPGPTDPFINPDVIVANRDTVKNKPDTIKAFIKAYHDKGIGYLTDSKTKAKAVQEIMDYMKSVGAGLDDLNSTAASVDAIKWYSLEDSRKLLTSAEFLKAATRQAQFWMDAGVTTKMPDIKAAINTTLIKM
jgi:ABC-type nitrate/sulfonate/bicarbonate transport system substrate-binding protein